LMVGEGRLFGRSEHYPITTRGAEFAKLLGNHGVNVRFGTEGSLVQIHSPRPFTHGLFRSHGFSKKIRRI
jgi:hypothetical protein